MSRCIRLSCSATLRVTPAEIAAGILDLDHWPTFTGYGPLPGIRSAAFETPPPANHETEPSSVVGTRIRVTNTDGSTHAEEIRVWDPEREIRIRLDGFSKPLRWFASHFDETWHITPHEDGTTAVERTFELHPRGWWGVPMLWFIRPLMRGAVMKHMRQIGIADESPAPAPPNGSA